MLKIMVVLLRVGDFDRMTCANKLEGRVFENVEELKNEIKKHKQKNKRGYGRFIHYELSEFMESFNDEDINADYWWFTYVQIKTFDMES